MDAQTKTLTEALAYLLEREKKKEENAGKQTQGAEVKVPLPAKFRGVKDPVVVENWIDDVDQYFSFTKMPEEQQFNFAVMFLEDKAKMWWRRHKETSGDDTIDNWEDLCDAIRHYFVPTGVYRQVRGKLHKLRHTCSVQRYAEEFQDLRAIAGDVSEAEALDRFTRGLRIPIQEYVYTNLT